MPDIPELGAIKIFFDGVKWIVQRFESAPGTDPLKNPYGLPAWWRPLASRKTLQELHKIMKVEQDDMEGILFKGTSYASDALRAIEQLMRRRGG